MYANLLILLPLFIGYLIPVKNKERLSSINRVLMWMIYIILFLMGIGLAQLDNLLENLKRVGEYTLVFLSLILLFNVIGLSWLNRYLTWPSLQQKTQSVSRLKMLFSSADLIIAIILGFTIGLTRLSFFKYSGDATELTLLVLLLLVGIQLRNSGLSLRHVLVNRNGILVSLMVVVSSLSAGAVAALVMGIPVNAGVSLASGFGWYSLSGSVLTKSLGPVLGTTAFFNDLGRELISLMLLPILLRRNMAVALGLTGATSMDFALPIIQKSGGMIIIPAAIVHVFILSLFAPILMAFFTG